VERLDAFRRAGHGGDRSRITGHEFATDRVLRGLKSTEFRSPGSYLNPAARGG
jgi:hypothetical protein